MFLTVVVLLKCKVERFKYLQPDGDVIDLFVSQLFKKNDHL